MDLNDMVVQSFNRGKVMKSYFDNGYLSESTRTMSTIITIGHLQSVCVELNALQRLKFQVVCGRALSILSYSSVGR